jgi:hypothetical protein
MLLCKIDTVSYDEQAQMGVVILITDSKTRALPIWVGLFEAQSILMKIQGTDLPRPLTHDLLKNCLDTFKIKIEYVLINDMTKNTFYAQLHMVQDNKKVVMDSRPSDAIAIAVRVEAPIYVEEKVFNDGGVDKNELLREQKEQLYRSFLESLPDDALGKFKH